MKIIKYDTQNNKKKYVDSLIDDNENVNSDYNIHLFSRDHGVYSGVVRLKEKSDKLKYYGFILNFPDSYFSLEGMSGKMLDNNASNLNKVFYEKEGFR